MDRRIFVGGILAAGGIGAFAVGRAASTPSPGTVPSDWMLVDGSENSLLSMQLIEEMRSVGVSCCNFNPLARTSTGLSLATEVLKFLDANSARVTLATSVRDIRAARGLGKVALVVGWQSSDAVAGDMGYSTPWTSNPTRSYLRAYYALGLRICGIAYNLANIFGGGCLDPTVPLTQTGRHLIEELHNLRILVDVGGHTGEQTSLDAIAMAPGVPVICSHTNAAALVDNPRNVSDRLVDAIASTGGVIGISAVNDFNARGRGDAAVTSTPQAPLDTMLDHIDYVRRRVGADHVGLGPDFTEGEEGFSINPAKTTLFPPEMASVQTGVRYVKGFERIGQLPNVISAMRDRRWPEADIRKILGENWLRVYEAAWGA